MKTNQERGTIRDGVSGFLLTQKATNPVPNGSPDGSLVGFQESCQRMISMINLRLETNS